MLNGNAMKDIEGKKYIYGHLETRQVGNGFKYTKNYIHSWKTHSTQD
jgi:hypothetical protein